jgi:hypothetical protein
LHAFLSITSVSIEVSLLILFLEHLFTQIIFNNNSLHSGNIQLIVFEIFMYSMVNTILTLGNCLMPGIKSYTCIEQKNYPSYIALPSATQKKVLAKRHRQISNGGDSRLLIARSCDAARRPWSGSGCFSFSIHFSNGGDSRLLASRRSLPLITGATKASSSPDPWRRARCRAGSRRCT